MMDMGYHLHLIDLLAKLYRKQLANVKVAETLPELFRVNKRVRQDRLFSVLVQHPSGDGHDTISRWTTNWTTNSHEPSLR